MIGLCCYRVTVTIAMSRGRILCFHHLYHLIGSETCSSFSCWLSSISFYPVFLCSCFCSFLFRNDRLLFFLIYDIELISFPWAWWFPNIFLIRLSHSLFWVGVIHMFPSIIVRCPPWLGSKLKAALQQMERPIFRSRHYFFSLFSSKSEKKNSRKRKKQLAMKVH